GWPDVGDRARRRGPLPRGVGRARASLRAHRARPRPQLEGPDAGAEGAAQVVAGARARGAHRARLHHRPPLRRGCGRALRPPAPRPAAPPDPGDRGSEGLGPDVTAAADALGVVRLGAAFVLAGAAAMPGRAWAPLLAAAGWIVIGVNLAAVLPRLPFGTRRARR